MAKIYFELTSDRLARHHLAQLLQDDSFLHPSDVAPQVAPYPEATAFKTEEAASAALHGRVGATPLMLEIEMSQEQAMQLLDKAASLHGGIVTDRKLALLEAPAPEKRAVVPSKPVDDERVRVETKKSEKAGK